MERVRVFLTSLVLCTPLYACEKPETTDVKKLLQKKPPLEITYQNGMEASIRFHIAKKGEDAIIHQTAQNKSSPVYKIISLTGGFRSCFRVFKPSILLVRDIKPPYTVENERCYSTENDSPITCVAVHQDEDQLAFGCQDGTAMHVNLVSKQTQQRTLSPHCLFALSYDQDGTLLIGLDVHNNATLWNIENGCCLRLCYDPELPISPKCSPSDQIVYSAKPAEIINLPQTLKDFLHSRLNDEQQKLLLKIIGSQQNDPPCRNEKTTLVEQINTSSFDERFKQLLTTSLATKKAQSLSLTTFFIALLRAFIP